MDMARIPAHLVARRCQLRVYYVRECAALNRLARREVLSLHPLLFLPLPFLSGAVALYGESAGPLQAAEHHPSAVISSSSDFLSSGIDGILSAHLCFASMSDAANWREMRDVQGRVYSPTTKP
jgi:hypothetical protein